MHVKLLYLNACSKNADIQFNLKDSFQEYQLAGYAQSQTNGKSYNLKV